MKKQVERRSRKWAGSKRLEDITLADCERVVGEPAAAWAGRCFEIASTIAASGLLKGTAVYGHWLGPVDPRSHFGKKGGAPFVRHGWIVLPSPDERVFDPTRWAFGTGKPALYLGKADHYDEGGNEWRAAMRRSPPRFDPSERRVDVPESIMDSATWRFVEEFLGIDLEQEAGTLSKSQLFWLANAPLVELGPHARGVYDAIERLGEEALVPIDNFRRVKQGRW